MEGERERERRDLDHHPFVSVLHLHDHWRSLVREGALFRQNIRQD